MSIKIGLILNQDIQNNKMLILGKLAASLAHEIRNPLSAIKLNLESIKLNDNDLDSDIIESVNASIDAADRIGNLIETTLAFSRKSNNSKSICNLNDVTVEAISLTKTAAKKRNILIKQSLSKKVPQSEFNSNKLLQVLINLITNAIEASPNKSVVEIKTKVTSKGFIVLDIIDSGSGISEENKPKIFSDFFTSKKQGTGLGLSVCKSLVEEQNGNISFKSKIGEGTKFTVSLPVTVTEDIIV